MTGRVDYRRHLVGIALAMAAVIWMFNSGRADNPLQPRSFDIREVDAPAAKSMIDQGALVIDVRGAEAYAAGHIVGAMLIPLDDLRAALSGKLAAAKTKRIVVYCGDGARSGPEGTAMLNQAGFANAVNLKGGMEGWEKAGMPSAKGRG